jgi:hypothetical protein
LSPEEVVPLEHRLVIDVRLLFGVVNHEVISCGVVSPAETRVGCG